MRAVETLPGTETGSDLHVLHVMEAIGGGTARHLIDICRAVRANHSVIVPESRVGAHTDPTALGELRDAGATVHVVPMRRSFTSSANARAILRVRRLILGGTPAVVHGHSSVGGAVARLAAVGTGVPVVWTPNGLITTQPAVAIERALARVTAASIAVSASEADQLRALRLGGRSPVLVIPNGLDRRMQPAPFDIRERLGLPEDTPLVVCIARLCAQKAPLDLVEAAALLRLRRPDVHVVLIGSGELADDVDDAVARHQLGATFHRMRQDTGASWLLPQATVAVQTSIYEGGPYLVLEAFRAGVPLVATGCVGTVDGIEDGVSGLLATPGDPASVADALLRVLADPILANRLAVGGRIRLNERFSISSMARSLENIYRELAGLPPALPREASRPHRRTDRSSQPPLVAAPH